MKGGDQTLAALLALAGSASYAVAIVIQHGQANRLRSGRAFDLAVLLRLARRPAWLVGLAAVIAGFVLQAAALGLGRLIVVEPMLASGMLFALGLAAWRDRRPLRIADWAAALAVVGGLAVFLIAGQPAGGQRTAGAVALGVVVAGATLLLGLCAILAGRFPGTQRALLLGVGGGAVAGATDALIKSVSVLATGHVLAVFADARLYLLVVAGLLTYTIQQNGYRAGGLAAFLPAFAVMEPVTGALLGLIIYHEWLRDGLGPIAVEVAACAVAVVGIAWLARSATVSGEPQPAGPASAILPGPASPILHGPAPAPVIMLSRHGASSRHGTSSRHGSAGRHGAAGPDGEATGAGSEAGQVSANSADDT